MEFPQILFFLGKSLVKFFKFFFTKNRTHLQFYIENPFKISSEQKKSSLKFGLKNTLQDRQVGDHFFKNPLQEGVFENSWGNTPTCLELHSHKKVVLHFFILMQLLPKTPPSTYLKTKKFKRPKMDSLFTFHFSLHFSLFTSLHFTSQLTFVESYLVPRYRRGRGGCRSQDKARVGLWKGNLNKLEIEFHSHKKVVLLKLENSAHSFIVNFKRAKLSKN